MAAPSTNLANTANAAIATNAANAVNANNATIRVLTNFDLVEDIILQLPLLDVLLSKRVSKAWKGAHDRSWRIKKALFLIPATDTRIYYPICSKPTWYMAPDREELAQAGVLSASEESDNDITPTDSSKRCASQPQTSEPTTETASVETAEAFKGKDDFSFTPEIEASIAEGGTDGKVSIKANVVRECGSGNGSGSGDQAASGKQADGSTETAKHQINSKAITLYHSEVSTSTIKKLAEMADLNGNTNMSDELVDRINKVKVSDEEVNRKFTLTPNMIAATPDMITAFEEGAIPIQNDIPRSLDGKMMVSRVTSPFLNPFFELFYERFYEGAVGRYVQAGWINVPRRGWVYYKDLIVQPPPRLSDGSGPGQDSKTQAVQRYNASWRQMHPLSAVTASMKVKCFENGDLTLRPEFAWALLSGELMEKLGRHWGTDCPECCITDYWFAEFIKDVWPHENNRGKHGVRKLGLNLTGWEMLVKLQDNKVQPTGEQDLLVPLGAYVSSALAVDVSNHRQLTLWQGS